MDRLELRARMPLVSGLLVCLGVLALACTTVGVSGDPESGSLDPALQSGSVDPRDQAESDRLLTEAQAALDSGNFSRAEQLALDVEASYGTARGSSRALWIRAQASQGIGKADEAIATVRRFRSYVPDDDARRAPMAILEGDALETLGRAEEAVTAWLAAPTGRYDADVRQRISGGVEKLSEADLVGLSESAGGPHVAPVLAELARKQFAAGAEADARLSARRALEAGATGRALRMAEAVLSGDMSEFLVTPVIGAVLPTSGSPRLQEFAEWIQQGIQIAIEQLGQPEGDRAATELVIRDDGGVTGNAPRLAAAMDSARVLGIIGPLQDGALSEMARARQGLLPMISPTAPIVPEGAEGVYSLAGDDPGASRALARYAMGSGLETAVVMYPQTRSAEFEALSFVEAFESMGGTVLRQFAYPTGATFFGDELQKVDSLRPDALVLPLPARDVELMAPQVTFYGLDSLEIRVLGTAGWTEESTLSRVATRHTNGVVAASPQRPDGESDGHRRFVDAYEAHHQRTLPSPVPALGYDAAALLLEAIRMGARTPAQLLANLESISGLTGATGVFSIDQGRVVREHFIACLQDRRVQPVPTGARAEPILLPPLPDPETDSIPEGAPDRIVGFRCPGFSPQAPPGR